MGFHYIVIKDRANEAANASHDAEPPCELQHKPRLADQFTFCESTQDIIGKGRHLQGTHVDEEETSES